MTTYFGSNKFKFGLFGINCGGGMTMSSAPERWRAEWSEIVAVAQLADVAGIEFLLPIAKWRGLGGDADMWGRSFETFTQAAALGALTKRTGLFVTAHVPINTPAFAAKAIATIDHVTGGRAGLNIVCGWNPDEFSIHGVTIDGERRYAQGLEWFKIYAKLVGGGAPFDWDGEFYRLRGAQTDPLPVQRPRPPIMSAGTSADGQDFAAQAADVLFTGMHDWDQVRDTVTRLKGLAERYERRTDVYVQTQMICCPTRAEAEEFYYYYAEEKADPGALAYFKRQKVTTLSRSMREGGSAGDRAVMARLKEPTGHRYAGIFPGVYPIVGTPDDIVAELARLSALGVAGCALIFLNYLTEMPYFAQEVLPRMARAGLRAPA